MIHHDRSIPLKPHTLRLNSLRICVDSLTMHFTALPRPLVLATIAPCERPRPMPLILHVLAFIAAAVGPAIQTEAVHIVI